MQDTKTERYMRARMKRTDLFIHNLDDEELHYLLNRAVRETEIRSVRTANKKYFSGKLLKRKITI